MIRQITKTRKIRCIRNKEKTIGSFANTRPRLEKYDESIRHSPGGALHQTVHLDYDRAAA
jgi:hypothetical protein